MILLVFVATIMNHALVISLYCFTYVWWIQKGRKIKQNSTKSELVFDLKLNQTKTMLCDRGSNLGI